MAIKQSLNFGLQLHGDGTSTTITLTLATAPVSFASPTGQDLTPTFALGSLAVTGVTGLSCSDNTITVTGTIGVLGLSMTLTFSSALAANTDYIISGTFLF
jgi:hypothetical protein